MGNSIIKARIEELRRIISHHNRLYYQNDSPEISDQEYDALFRELSLLEKEHPEFDEPDSPTKKVGGMPAESFEKFEHAMPLLSLDSVYDITEILNFDQRVKKLAGGDIDYVCEPKLDGLSVEVQYQNGLYSAGATRGDGYTGEDVTSNIKTIRNLPLSLSNERIEVPDFLSIRGEVLMPISAFRNLNRELAESGKAPFANCRNASAGSLRLLDPGITSRRPLLVFFYDILDAGGISHKNHTDELDYLRSVGLPVVFSYKPCKDINEAVSYKSEIENSRETLDFDIDGFVIKVNSLVYRKVLGEKERSPRWAVAVKFSPDQAETVIKDIYFQVGRTGIITPVAELEPVILKGARISRVSLHNFDYTAQKDIRKNDHVIVQRAGDVIPEVVSAITEKRDGSQRTLKPPVHCPVCQSPVYREGAYLYCSSPISCPSQILYSINHFASKYGMDIDSLSSKTIQTLLDHRKIKDVSDIYSLKKSDMASLPLLGEKSASNLVKAIEASKKRPLGSFLFALGIRGVGQHLSNLLARRFSDLKNLMAVLSKDAEDAEKELNEINEIGPKIAANIVKFFKNERNIRIVKRLLELGVSPEPHPARTARALEEKSFVITGSLEKYTRSQAQNLIIEKGGIVQASVSKSTNYLIVGENPGSKLERAKKLGINIISEGEFEDLLNSN